MKLKPGPYRYIPKVPTPTGKPEKNTFSSQEKSGNFGTHWKKKFYTEL